MEDLILYSTGCPKCNILKKKLDSKGVNYKIKTDMSEVINLGYTSAPLLRTDKGILEFPEAVRYVSEIN